MTAERNTFGRRTFVSGTVAGAAVLAGCGGEKESGGAAESTKVTLPTHVAFGGAKPELPGNEQGLEPGYLSFPKQLAKTVTKAPGDGSTITALTEIWTTPPPPLDKNPFWQMLNGKLGLTLNLILGVDPTYPDQFQTKVAGGDLPDLLWIPPNQGITKIAELLDAKCVDLTSYLSGDAVKEFPNLASLKPAAWKTAVVNGKIWGAPIPSTPFGQVYVGNKPQWDAVGGFQCKNADEFLQKAKELTRPKDNRWALEPAFVNALHMFGEWYGVPNGWRKNPDGTLVNRIETDEYAAALEFAVKCQQAGVFFPDPSIADSDKGTVKFRQGGIAAMVNVGPRGARESYRKKDPNFVADVLVPFSADGKAKPVYDMGYGTIGFTAFKKTDEKRVRMLLEVINYLSAPFGSEERMFIEYGAPGVHFNRNAKGAPEWTKNGEQQVDGVASGLTTMASNHAPIFSEKFPDDTKYIYEQEKKLLAIAEVNPTNGHYSDAYTSKSAKLGLELKDFVNDVVLGRKKVSDLDAMRTKWKNGGGDTMREEYQKSIAAG